MAPAPCGSGCPRSSGALEWLADRSTGTRSGIPGGEGAGREAPGVRSNGHACGARDPGPPDGRWLVVDGGFFASQGANEALLLIDLQTLKAVKSFALGKSPVEIEFGSDGDLLVLFDKRSVTSDIPGVLLDIPSGEKQAVALPTHGWIRGLMPAN